MMDIERDLPRGHDAIPDHALSDEITGTFTLLCKGHFTFLERLLQCQVPSYVSD